MIDVPAPPTPEAIEVTPLPERPLPLAALAAGSSPLDLGDGGANGNGTGSGSGTGPGAGSGRGDGDLGERDAYARADWVQRPPPESWTRNWPRGRERLAEKVVVKLSCRVRRSGKPHSCIVRSEQPARLGFGATARAVLRDSLMKPVARNGETLWDLPVLVTIVFDAIETAPRIPVNEGVSVPPAR